MNLIEFNQLLPIRVFGTFFVNLQKYLHDAHMDKSAFVDKNLLLLVLFKGVKLLARGLNPWRDKNFDRALFLTLNINSPHLLISFLQISSKLLGIPKRSTVSRHPQFPSNFLP